MNHNLATMQKSSVALNASGIRLQRKCAVCGQHSIGGNHCDSCDKEMSQTAASHDVRQFSSNAISQPVTQPRFSHDFSSVRVHTDSPSVTSMNANLLQRQIDVDKDKPKNPPKDEGKAPPSDSSKAPATAPTSAPVAAAKGPCSGSSAVSGVKESDKRMNGSAVTATVDPSDFGNTSKLGADFKFSACKVGKTWRFQIDALVVPVVSAVQPVSFRKNVTAATDTVVDKTTYSDIVEDLSPTRTGTFTSSCGGKTNKDKVTTYSRRKEYWNQQFVIDHEAFHRKDWVSMYKTELTKAESDVWGYSLAEADAADATAAVAKANPDLTKFMTDAYGRLCDAYGPKKESRAYDAGAPAYQKLVDDINTRAKKEKW